MRTFKTHCANLNAQLIRLHSAGFGSTELSKKLAQLVKMEKNVMRSMELVGRERMEVAVSLRHRINSLSPLLTLHSNNCRSGVRDATMTYPMLPISLVCCSTKWASSRTPTLTSTINTVSPSRAFATSSRRCSQAETVSFVIPQCAHLGTNSMQASRRSQTKSRN